MMLLKAVLHFIAAFLAGMYLGSIIVHCVTLLPLNTWYQLRIVEPSLVLGSLAGGAILGLNTSLPRRLGVWLGCAVAIPFIFWGNYVTAFMYSQLDFTTHMMVRGLTRNFLEHAIFLFCSALAGYCGQLWVGKWKRERSGEREPSTNE